MKRILITGGAGFVGSHLAFACRERFGAKVVVLDNLHRKGSELNVPDLKKAGVKVVRGDVRNPEDVASCGKCDLLIECSAEPSVLAGMDGSPDYVVHTNLTGALHCFEHARKHGAGVMFLSTSRVYPIEKLSALAMDEEETRFVLSDEQPFAGVSSKGISEEFPIDGTRSYYGASKLAAEIMLAEYGASGDVPYVVNRFGVIAGPRQMGKVDQGVAALWVARHIFGGDLSYIGYGGTGKQVRDMLHIDDAVRLIMMQIESLSEHSGGCFNVGGGWRNAMSLCELTGLCEAAAGSSIEIGSVPETRPADVPIYITDNSKVQRAFDWRPEKSMSAIIGDIARWMRDDAERVRPIFS